MAEVAPVDEATAEMTGGVVSVVNNEYSLEVAILFKASLETTTK